MKTIHFIIAIIGLNFTLMGQEATINIIDQKLQDAKTPGIVYLVINKDEVIYESYRGMADIGQKKPVTATTEFKMYSATKIITDIAIFQLYEKGLVDLEAPISKYLPEYKFSDDFNIKQLLSHTSGLTNKPLIKQVHLDSEHTTFNEGEAAEKVINDNLKLKNKPGQKKAYSNLGYLVLGKVIENVSGRPYKDYIQDSVFSQINGGENKFGFEFTDQTASAYHKTGPLFTLIYKAMVDKKYWAPKEGGFYKFNKLHINFPSYGGAFANAESLLMLGQELLNPKSKLLKPETVKLMMTEQNTNKGKPCGHTLGLWLGEVNGQKYVCHPGGGGGFSIELRMYPDKGLVSVLQMNKTQTFKDLKFLSELDEIALSF